MDKPFIIEVINAELIKEEYNETIHSKFDNPDGEEIDNNTRLNLTVSIQNKSELTLEKVHYKIALNEEAKPFIASGVVERVSDDFLGLFLKIKKNFNIRNQ